ncbi:MAG TPA: hypothetical protein DHW25_06195 [Blautia sp.]|nr:putative uncharacterized protein [Ruminococcus sp. CAG:60]HCL09472.1 hypothetical protein [Blautia sp.]
MAFQLKSNRKESENKTIRFPVALIEQIEKAIQNQDVTFSSFVIQACEYALQDMENFKNNE